MRSFALLTSLLFAFLPMGGKFAGFNLTAAPPDTEDSIIFVEKQQVAQQQSGTVTRTLAVARSFIGTPYAAGTLEVNQQEDLVVNLRQLDCWTFVENAVAIAQEANGDFEQYKEQLRQLRYWGGAVEGYGSRIHYFTGWMLQAEKVGYLQDVTRALGGKPYAKKVSFISNHMERYPKLQDAQAFHDLKIAEKRINSHAWYFIPKAKVASMEHKLREGDIILLTSSKAGLDIAHEGFAVRKNGRIHLLNASSLHKRVVISEEPLAQYLATQRGQSGIMVARLINN